MGRGSLHDLSEERTEGGPGHEHHSDVEVIAHPPDPLTNTSYVREIDSGWPLLLPFPTVFLRRPGCRARRDEGVRITKVKDAFPIK